MPTMLWSTGGLHLTFVAGSGRGSMQGGGSHENVKWGGYRHHRTVAGLWWTTTWGG